MVNGGGKQFRQPEILAAFFRQFGALMKTDSSAGARCYLKLRIRQNLRENDFSNANRSPSVSPWTLVVDCVVDRLVDCGGLWGRLCG